MITVIIPAYNEARRLPVMLADIESFHSMYPAVLKEVIVVDDGSGDSTVESALYYLNRIPLRIERMVVNSGKWAAIRRGIDSSETDYVLLLDADCAVSIFTLLDIKGLKGYMKRKVAFFGTRFDKKSVVEGKSGLRLVVSYGYRLFVMLLYRLCHQWKVDDMQAPFKLFCKSSLRYPLTVSRFAGDLELALSLEGEIINVPLFFSHKQGSRVAASSVFQMAWESILIASRHGKRVKEANKLYNSSVVKP